ncbi:MAG: dihydrofolate reductase [Sphingobacteriaceae bacterium]|nr:dihydrofolate reductase [Sphingobacteriaceae bacterium]
MILSAVVVTDLNNAIGCNNKLLCHLPADLKFFKTVTMGSPIIMGRKTYESIGRLLPGRRNVIITRNLNYKVEGADVYGSIQEAIDECKNEEKVFIIGGAEIYKQSMQYLNEIYRTLIQYKFEADTFFGPIDEKKFKKTWSEEHNADEKNAFDYTFEKYERI